MNKHYNLALVLSSCLICFNGAAEANVTTYSLTDDFSTTGNPNGAWSYGWLNTLGGTFTAYTLNNGTWGAPSVSTYLLLGSGWFHPGAQNQLSDFRFTAPVEGTYSLDFTFKGDQSLTATDVHINNGATSLFSAFVNGSTSPKSFIGDIYLNANQTLDIAVGYGNNGNNYYDTTTVQGIISTSAVPLPASFALFGSRFGLVSIAARRFKKMR
jgi:hypothetical protein